MFLIVFLIMWYWDQANDEKCDEKLMRNDEKPTSESENASYSSVIKGLYLLYNHYEVIPKGTMK